MEMDYELSLTDLIDIKILQKIQDCFAGLTGFSVIITDEKGDAITEGSDFSAFCKDCIRTYGVQNTYCRTCKKAGEGVEMKEKPVNRPCPAGLVNYTAPVKANGKLLGYFVAGQLLTAPSDPDKVRKMAVEVGRDPEAYVALAQNMKIWSCEEVERDVRFLHTFSDAFSDMAHNKYLLYYANLELEKSASMKSDFLANMSHEIRTPMNAVIGMAEMALREGLSSTAREYINQIKEAGKSLLTIINDILDFSKIESGKMDINPVEYEPMSMVYDVANIAMTRLKGKEVELILNVSPNLPNKLMGDNIRLKQILLNLANNAAKFTSHGKITMNLDYVELTPDEVELQVSIEDTGIGIKKEDMDRLFQSFQQLDSKRNRNIEGTGLGLAISKQLLTLMQGRIWVESQYEVGSKFFFTLPQHVVDGRPCIHINDRETILVAGYFFNSYVRDRFFGDIKNMDVAYKEISSVRDLETLPKDRNCFLFIEHSVFSVPFEEYTRNHPECTVVLLIDFFDHINYDIPNLFIVRKPLFALNIAMILNGEEIHLNCGESMEKDFDFVAPDAEILIVDDNMVNLTVAEGLLEPLKMKVDVATSGKIAIDKIGKYHYDIVFMDHMMPELDGVETTRLIRRFHPDYNDVPIIALTANAVEGTKEMFCQEGMNDFIAKPIELRMLISKVKQWLPVEKIQKIYTTQEQTRKPEEDDNANIMVGDLDVAYALKFLGGESLFWTVLKVYYRSIEKKAALIEELRNANDWPGFTIEVHALKSSSKQIGAISLSEKAAALEKAGNARDTLFIRSHTDEMLEQYRGYLPVLRPFCAEGEENEGEKQQIDMEELLHCFTEIRMAAEDLDMDRMDEIIEEMKQYRFEDWQEDSFAQLWSAVEDFDVDRCECVLQEWEQKLL